jgi:hypothetical protein
MHELNEKYRPKIIIIRNISRTKKYKKNYLKTKNKNLENYRDYLFIYLFNPNINILACSFEGKRGGAVFGWRFGFEYGLTIKIWV